ncbi:MAG: hypothetical protein Q8Q09_16690 [Deltaproteobacteria bacterium]|nr:hypothetical protein [Deltaproteobacteria bacterium]
MTVTGRARQTTRCLMVLAATMAAGVAIAPRHASAQSQGLSFSTPGSALATRTRRATPDPLRPPATNDDEELLRRNYWSYRSVTALRLNPLGLYSEIRASYRSRLYQDLATLFRESFVAITPVATISPAWARVGAIAEIQPLAILNLSAGYEFIGSFGSFDTVQSWNSPQARASDREQDQGTPNKWAYATTGTQLSFGALLQLRVGNSLVVRSNARAFYVAMNTRVPDAGQSVMDPASPMSNVGERRGTRVWYDILYDLLLPSNGWFAHIDSDVLYSPEGAGLTIGLRHSYTQAFWNKLDFERTDFCAGSGALQRGTDAAGCNEYADPNGPMHRFGPIIAYNFRESHHARFNAPTVFVAVQWWMQHRYRTGGPNAIDQALGSTTPRGDYASASLPYIAAGFSFRGDLLYPRGR